MVLLNLKKCAFRNESCYGYEWACTQMQHLSSYFLVPVSFVQVYSTTSILSQHRFCEHENAFLQAGVSVCEHETALQNIGQQKDRRAHSYFNRYIFRWKLDNACKVDAVILLKLHLTKNLASFWVCRSKVLQSSIVQIKIIRLNLWTLNF